MLTSKQRAYLRKNANDIPAIFQIGKGGINDAMVKQLEDVLEVRELIKIKVLENSGLSVRESSAEVCEKTGAEPVQCIGRMIVIYKEAKEKEHRHFGEIKHL